MPEEDFAENMQERAKEVERLAMEAEAEAVSEDSAVRVVAGPSGRVKEIDLRVNAFGMSGVELGEMIVETIKSAGRKVDAEMAQAVEEALGPQLSGAADEDEGGSQ